MKLAPIVQALVVIGIAVAPLSARADDDAATLTTQIQALDSTATTRSPGAVSGKIADQFQTFAGSSSNSARLVEGLRTGSTITLTAPGQPSATFTPSTKPMGFGNVSTSLSLAQYQLAQQGITSPTPAQLQTALEGGTIIANGRTVTYQGVLQMRASGMGWGEIAQASGTKLGPVVSGVKSHAYTVSTLPAVSGARGIAPTVSTQPVGHGIVTASGATVSAVGQGQRAPSTAGSDHGQGKGLVKANGVGATGTTTATGVDAGRGQGIVTASGVAYSSGATAGTGRSGVVTAAGGSGGGGGSGNGKAVGHAK